MVLEVSVGSQFTAVKGSVIGGLAAVLTARGLVQQVAGMVSPPARAILLEPPLPTMWIDARVSNQIYQALFELVGADELRRLNREAIARGVQPLLHATIQRVLAIFGTSPATLLQRFDRASGTTSRGIAFRWDPVDARSGYFDVEFLDLKEVPPGPFVATGGALEIVFDLCQTRGAFGDPQMVPNGRDNRMRYAVSWQ